MSLEAEIIADAGCRYAVTISTNMAGRSGLRHRRRADLLLVLGPLLFVWGLREHWLRRKNRAETK